MPRPPAYGVTYCAWSSGSQYVQVNGTVGAVMSHAHRSVCIIAMLHGSRTFTFAQEERVLVPGQVLVIAAGCVHSCTPVRDYAVTETSSQQVGYACLCVPARRLQFTRSCVMYAPELAVAVNALVEEAENELIQALEDRMDAGDSTVDWIMGTDVENSENSIPHDVRMAVEAIVSLENDRAFSLELLAKRCNEAPLRLSRRFSSYIGMPPVAWHMLRRIQRGASLLAQGHGITDVAYLTGFYDQSHFSHRFRQIMGMTPGQYFEGVRRSDERVTEG